MTPSNASSSSPHVPNPGRTSEDGPGDTSPWEVRPHPRSGQLCVQSRRALSAGEVLTAFGAATVEDHPSRMTVQVSEHAHITLAPPSLAFINHGCAPNVHFDVERRLLVALHAVEAGEELTFFYPSTEWSMASPFDCHCQSSSCLRWIGGASQVPASALVGRLLAPHIERLLESAGRAATAPGGAR